MHNSFWGWTDNTFSTCTVAGYIGAHDLGTGARSKYTFVIECDGHFYPARHSAIASALTDAAVKRRVQKSPPPRAICMRNYEMANPLASWRPTGQTPAKATG